VNVDDCRLLCCVLYVLLQSAAFLAWLKEAEEDDSDEEDSDK
jgi:hypothetical protein